MLFIGKAVAFIDDLIQVVVVFCGSADIVVNGVVAILVFVVICILFCCMC